MSDEDRIDELLEALSFTVLLLLARRIGSGGGEFERAVGVTSDVAEARGLVDRARALVIGAASTAMARKWRADRAQMARRAAAHGAAVVDTPAAVKRAPAALRAVLDPLIDPRRVMLLCRDGQWRGIDAAWRETIREAAALEGAVAEDFMAPLAERWSRHGLAVSMGDSGAREIAGAVRSAVYEQMARISDEANEEARRSAGMDAYEVSVHFLCAEDHLDHQGRIYTVAEMNEVNAGLERPIGRGVMNCRHFLMPCYSDDEPSVPPEVVEEAREASLREVTYHDLRGRERTCTAYEATQVMRRREVEIRRTRQLAALTEAAGGDPEPAMSLARSRTKAYRDLCAELGEPPQMRRTRAYKMA